MEQEKNYIDKQFQQRLFDAEAAPPVFVWEGIERALRKKRRRRYLLWLFAAGLAGMALWGGLQIWLPGNDAGSAGVRAGQLAQQPGSEDLQAFGARAEDAVTLNNEYNAGSQETDNKDGISDEQPSISPNGGVPAIRNTSRSAGLEKRDVSADHAVTVEGLPTTDAPENNNIEDPATNSSAALALLEPADNTSLVFRRETPFPKLKPFIRKNKDPHYCYDFSQKPVVWLLDVYAGPAFSNRKLESSAPAFDQYRQQRLDTEHPDFSFNAGVRGSLLFGRHFLLRTGLHYEQMTEVFEYADPNYIKYLVEITQTVVDGKPVTLIDTIGVDYGENYVKTYNRYGMLDIPLEAGVELRRGRFGLSLNGGVSLNILFWKRGTILMSGGSPEPFTPGEKHAVEVYRKSTGLSVGGSAQLFFHLQPRLRVFAEPYFRKVLRPVTLDDQPVEQRYGIKGIKIGMTKILD
ncbi:MAG: hypothetical protein R2791_09180 [Saprospiraceae bacterium]